MRWLAASVMVAACGRVGFDAGAAIDAPLTYRDVVLADGPSGYWRLGDVTSVAHDETGRADGTYSGACTHDQPGALVGDPDSATQFDGATCNVQLADHYDYVGNGPFTIEVWVNEAKLGVYQHFFTSETRSGMGPVEGFALLTANTDLRFERADAMVTIPIDVANLPVGSFTYLVATYDGATLELFVNGSSVMSAIDNRALVAYDVAGYLGAAGPGASQNSFEGVLDEVAIYDHVLAPDRITLHRAVALGQP